MGDVYVCVYGGSPGGGLRTRAVRLAESTRRVNAADFEADRAPESAITVGPATICEARGVLLLASGANKARAVAAAVEVSEEVPASVVRRDPKRIFLIDEGAGSDLEGGLAD